MQANEIDRQSHVGGENMAQEIEVKISNDGKVELGVVGAKGRSCLDVTEQIEKLLGEMQSRQLCSEYYEMPSEAKTRLQTERQNVARFGR
jgi:hypothetical protein